MKSDRRCSLQHLSKSGKAKSLDAECTSLHLNDSTSFELQVNAANRLPLGIQKQALLAVYAMANDATKRSMYDIC